MTGRRSILIASAEAPWAEFVERRLRRRGHTVERMSDPREIAERAFSAVIADGVQRLEALPRTTPLLRVAPTPPEGVRHDWISTPFELALIVEALERRLRPGADRTAIGAPPTPPPVRTGAEFFDASFGGVSRGRALLIRGPSGAGKSVFALQFLARGLSRRERGLLLSPRASGEVAEFARALRLPLDEPIESGRLLALDSRRYAPERGPAAAQIPSAAFEQLAEILLSNRIRRVALDPVSPWLENADEAAARSFLRALERMGVTTLLTLPAPGDADTLGLAARLEPLVAVSARLECDAGGALRWRCVRANGAAVSVEGIVVTLQPGIGLRRVRPPRA